MNDNNNFRTLSLPDRPSKPREKGLTFLADVGLPTKELLHLLEDYHTIIDFAKFGVGSAYVTPHLNGKIELYNKYSITPYFGGTLFEKFYHQGKLSDYCEYLKSHDIQWIEISNGTIDLDLAERCRIIETVKEDFQVIAEVGCKDVETIMSPSVWIRELNELISAGASYVVTEGRDSGSAGIFRPSGELREGLIADILDNVPLEKLVFEAPTANSQMYFINLCGNNVNLANIPPRDALLLEAQRNGLRYETFHYTEPPS